MKALVLTTAIALGFAAPSFANDQLAAALGVEPGQFTTAQLIDLDRALEEGDHRRADHILSGGGTVRGLSAAGAAFALDQAAQDDDGPVGTELRSAASEIISTQSFTGPASDNARALAIEHALENDDRRLARFLENGGSLVGTRTVN